MINDTVTSCRCYNNYEGENCEIGSQSVKTAKNVSRATIAIAIVSIISFYIMIIVSDIFDYLLRNQSQSKGKK